MIVTNGFGSLSIVTSGYGRRDSLYGYVVPTAEDADREAVPATSLTLEGLPGRGASQDGAYTEVDQDGAWTEYDLDGAYTADNAYIDEAKPMNFFTDDGVPTYAGTDEGVPTKTRIQEAVPA